MRSGKGLRLSTAASSNYANIWRGCAARRKRFAFAEIPEDENIIDEIKRTLAANKMRDGVTFGSP